jgi:hypothetical protein
VPGRRVTAEHLFLAAGAVSLLSALLADLVITLLAADDGGHGDRQLLLLANFAPMGIAFITWGYGHRFGKAFLDGKRGLALLLAFTLLLFDGVIHLFAFDAHLDEPLPAAFFLLVGGAQLMGAFRLPRAAPRELAAWASLTAVLVALYVLSRTVGLLGEVEIVDSLGLLSKGAEIALLGALLYRLYRSGPASAAGGGVVVP